MGGRKQNGCWNNIHIVNGIIPDTISSKKIRSCAKLKVSYDCAGYVVGGLRRLCGGFMKIMPRCGSILQAGTCQILR